MNRREFLKVSSKGLACPVLLAAGGCSAGMMIDEAGIGTGYADAENACVDYPPDFTRLHEYQDLKLPGPGGPEKYVTQRIEKRSEELLPFILKHGRTPEYAFRKVRTHENEFAETLLVYNPLHSTVDRNALTTKTIITEETDESVLPPLTARNIRRNAAALCPAVPEILGKRYIFQWVAYAYEDSEMTDFYLMPSGNAVIERAMFGNVLIRSPEGVFRGVSLDYPKRTVVEKVYALEMF